MLLVDKFRVNYVSSFSSSAFNVPWGYIELGRFIDFEGDLVFHFTFLDRTAKVLTVKCLFRYFSN